MGNMRFKVGDRVRIKNLDWYNENKDELGNIDCGDALMITEKSPFCGKIVTISNISDVVDAYKIENDNGCYNWTDEMIEGLVEEEVFIKANDIYNEEYSKGEYCHEQSFKWGFQEGYNYSHENDKLEISLKEGYIFKDENGNVINATKIVLEKKKKEYPKTYEECAKIMNCPIDGPSGWLFNFDANIKDPYYRKIDILVGKFTRLLICRDAYWKIAGEEMGLGKSWEPDWTNYNDYKFVIGVFENEIIKCYNTLAQYVLAFPTEEMRDAFYEVFKKEIKLVKELL